MNRFKAIFFLVLFCASATFPQTTYYVSSSQGNDSNSGTSENAPFKSLSKVNGLNLKPGDKVLFKSGDVWEGQNLIIKDSGTESNRIVFSSYGSGEKPIISLKQNISPTNNWKDPASWTKYSNNVWWIQYPDAEISQTTAIRRIWLDGQETSYANHLDGDNYDGTFGVVKNHGLYHDIYQNRLYIYSQENPANAYTNIEYSGWIDNDSPKSILYTIDFMAISYIIIDGLDIRGGIYSAISVKGCKYITIVNSKFGWDSQVAGLRGSEGSSHIIIDNDTIDSGYRLNMRLDTGDGALICDYGLSIGDNAEYFTVKDCYIRDWKSGGVFSSAHRGYSRYHSIYNNEFMSPDIAYSKAIQIDAWQPYGDTYCKIYNNYIHDFPTWAIQICSNYNKIYFNLFENINKSTSHHSNFAGGGAIQLLIATTDLASVNNNIFFNNTIDSTYEEAIRNFAAPDNQFFNNLIINASYSSDGYPAFSTNKSNNIFSNNVIYYPSKTIEDPLISILGSGITLNSLLETGLNIFDNVLFEGSLSSLLKSGSYEIPIGSIALKKGVDISKLVPEGFKDMYGNIVNRKNPNIGAIDNQTLTPTGLKIFLEGPYKNGSMSTKLNDQGLIPKSQPYNVYPWNYDGSESVSEVPKNIVDWILVELRNPLSPSSIVAQKAAFLRNDGSITALDGISKLSFGNLTGAYYIVIKHRNHLAVRSSLPVLLVNGNLEYDFTTALNKAYGSNGLVKLDDSVYGMYGGDTDGNGVIDDKDVTDVGSNLFKTGYQKEDVNLNSPVNVLDYKLPNENKSKSSQASSE